MQMKKNLGIRQSRERWERLNRIAYKQETSIQKLIDEAINKQIFGEGEEAGGEHDTRHWARQARVTMVEAAGLIEQQGDMIRRLMALAKPGTRKPNIVKRAS